MIKIKKRYTNTITLLILSTLILGIFIPIGQAVDIDRIEPFEKGPSYKGVVPLKKTTFVGYNKNNFLDDYAYLAAVPTSVFSEDNVLYSHPLLFFEEEYKYKEDKERSLNAYQGLDYFMQDWAEFCNNNFDQVTLINVDKKDVEQWGNSREYKEITGDDPFDIANQIALNEWSYSDEAVIAVIEEDYKLPDNKINGVIKGTLSSCAKDSIDFEVEEPVVGTGGTYKYFEVNNQNYKYLVAELTWPNLVDYDLQLYDTQLGMVDTGMNGYPEQITKGLIEVAGSFIHNYGKWGVSVTAVPVKSVPSYSFEDQDDFNLMDSLKELGRKIKNVGKVKINLYPGTVIEIDELPSYGCKDVEITLKWDDSNSEFGISLLDPAGNEICSSISREEVISGKIDKQEGKTKIHVEGLGECRDDERYSVCIFSVDDISHSIDYDLEYSWKQNYTRKEGECFASATNGAVLSSNINAPLLYVSPSDIKEDTKDVLYKLGVEKAYLINIGGYLSEETKREIKEIVDVEEFTDSKLVYNYINEKSGNEKTVVFTTINPWTYWYVAELQPAGEYPGALHVGPAAYIAAHHGSPVIIVDNHPLLSQAVVYPNDFWVKAVKDRIEPTSGSMVIAGRQVYEFLEEFNLGKLEEGKAEKQIQETIITVAGQYDIGTPWDRMFTGAALPGRFCFSPVDASYWISRNVFYPAMIFVNPSVKGEVNLINGSSSKSQLIGGRLKKPYGSTLVITKPSQDEAFKYPILQTYASFSYKFNEKASKHWDFYYERADGIIPYITHSTDPIDNGATNKKGAYYPDMSETEVIPYYAREAGYDNVYTTNFDSTVENLNRGVVLWVENCHGWQPFGGLITMWDPDNPYVLEDNPWRAYEPLLLYPGHIREFIRYIIYGLSMESGSSSPKIISEGLFNFHLFPEIGCTENPDVACVDYYRIFLNKLAKNVLHLPIDFWSSNGIMIYRDRIKNPIKSIKDGLPLMNIYNGDGKVTICPRSGQFPVIAKNGLDFDNALENIHSCGLNTISCLPACTYLHMTWMRHGMVYQIIDPWTTTDWAGVWNQMMIKRFAMGDTVGEAYELGMRAVGPEYVVGQWWWDKWENVELFGDPQLRVFVPSKEYSDENSWDEPELLSYDDELNINGHMPFGATDYPHQRKAKNFVERNIIQIGFILLLIIVVFTTYFKYKKKK